MIVSRILEPFVSTLGPFSTGKAGSLWQELMAFSWANVEGHYVIDLTLSSGSSGTVSF